MWGTRLGPPVSSEIRGGWKGPVWDSGGHGVHRSAHITTGSGREASGQRVPTTAWSPFHLVPFCSENIGSPAPAPGILYS